MNPLIRNFPDIEVNVAASLGALYAEVVFRLPPGSPGFFIIICRGDFVNALVNRSSRRFDERGGYRMSLVKEI